MHLLYAGPSADALTCGLQSEGFAVEQGGAWCFGSILSAEVKGFPGEGTLEVGFEGCVGVS